MLFLVLNINTKKLKKTLTLDQFYINTVAF